MKTITATEFKNKAAEVIKDVSTSGKSIVVTNRGKAVVEVKPVKENKQPVLLGAMIGTGRVVGDIVSPVFEEWETLDPNEDPRRKRRK